MEPSDAQGRVAAELHENTYDPKTDTVTWSNVQSGAHAELLKHYEEEFHSETPAHALQAHLIGDPGDIRTLTAFFAWSAWTATANQITSRRTRKSKHGSLSKHPAPVTHKTIWPAHPKTGTSPALLLIKRRYDGSHETLCPTGYPKCPE